MGIGRSKPLDAAAQQAMTLRTGAEGNLRSALTQYINAVKGLSNNARTNDNVRKALNSTMFKKGGANTTNSLSKVLANSVAKIVQSSSAGLWAAAEAQASQQAAAKQAAANYMKKAAKDVNELNKILNKVFEGVNRTKPANMAAAYSAKRGNNKLAANKALNAARRQGIGRLSRAVPARYTNLWTALAPAAPPPTPGPLTQQQQANLNKALSNLSTAVGSVSGDPNNNASYSSFSPNNLKKLDGAIRNSIATVERINKGKFNANIKAKANKIAAKLAILIQQPAPPTGGSELNRTALNAALAAIVAQATVNHGAASNNTAKANIKTRAKNAIRQAAKNAGIPNANINTNQSVSRNIAQINALNP